PGLPRDLDTIILKCLRKDPDERYASAAALEDDLRRFLDGEPIRARPVSSAERLVKWARRHPARGALTVAAALLLLAAGLLGIGYPRYLQLREANQKLGEGKAAAEAKAETSAREKLHEEYLADVQGMPGLYAAGRIDQLLERLRKYEQPGED